MTEKEKMLAGELYTLDQPLKEELMNAKELCHAYNQLNPSQKEERRQLIRKLFGRVGTTFLIEQPFICDYGFNIEIGENFYANHHLTILDGNKVIFGDDILIAPNCSFYTAGHPLEPELRKAGLEYAKPIRIGNRVWIGGNTVVLPGVTIGDDSVIGAGSVVTKDIPAGVVAVGNPCKVVRKIEREME